MSFKVVLDGLRRRWRAMLGGLLQEVCGRLLVIIADFLLVPGALVRLAAGIYLLAALLSRAQLTSLVMFLSFLAPWPLIAAG